MENTVFIKSYSEPEFDMTEILRYSQMKKSTPQFESLVTECINEVRDKLLYKVCWSEFPVCNCGELLDLGFIKTESVELRKNLKKCSSIVLFAATVGIELDRLISKYSAVSPVKSLCLQAIGAERIESLCDTFCRDIQTEKCNLKKGIVPRFSPGYGDFPIEIQRDIFRVLEPSRKIGLTLNGSLMMSPSKSVTAILGISEELKNNPVSRTCDNCRKKDCEYRRKV